ncbi:MAG: ribonuclease P protein component [Woeseiaceae bacterium]|nr:ribonuclease P protein component [Woeseiaceae bacterium]
MPKAVPDSRHNRRQRRRQTNLPSGTRTGGDDSDARFRRSNRLSDSDAFRAVFRQSKRSKDELFTVLYRRTGKRQPRLGLAMSKKQCPRATARNRLKRLVRESFRHNKSKLTGLDIVVMNTRKAQSATNGDIKASLERHWRRCAVRDAANPGA